MNERHRSAKLNWLNNLDRLPSDFLQAVLWLNSYGKMCDSTRASVEQKMRH